MNPRIDGLRRSLADVLDPLIPAGSRCALVDFPAHPNVGDSAIWLGEKAYLRDRGVTLAYTCDVRNYSSRVLDRALDGGTILIHGGGNFGDLWPHHHALRLKVLRDFPGRRIIQLPQSVHFGSPDAREDTKRAIDTHGNFVMVARDHGSFERFTQHFSAPCHLAPDSAFYLGQQRVGRTPASDLFWLKRFDKEALGENAAPNATGIPTQDWLQDGLVVRRLEWMLRTAKKRAPRVKRLEKRLYDAMARARVRRGYRILGQGRVVITERLHGHILCVLAGIPNVLIDNIYGKSTAFYETWMRDWPGTRVVPTTAGAAAAARELLHESEYATA